MSYNIWQLMAPEAVSGRKVHGSVSSKVLAANGISKLKVARIRKKDIDKGTPVFLSTPAVTVKEQQHCCSCRDFGVAIGRLTNLNLQKAKGTDSDIAASSSQRTTALSRETRQSRMNLGFKAGDRFLYKTAHNIFLTIRC
jgi:hypothetical protein